MMPIEKRIEATHRHRQEIGLDLRDAAQIVATAGTCQPHVERALLRQACALTASARDQLEYLLRELDAIEQEKIQS